MSPLRCSYLNGRTLHFQLKQDTKVYGIRPAPWASRYTSLSDFSRQGGQGPGFEGLEVELLGGVVDVDSDHVALGIEVHDQTFGNLARVRLRIIMELHFRVLRL